MSDHDALLRAICADPDDDTPRLILADWLEEDGQADRAAFVRAQVERARLPSWDPFAAHFRHRRPDWRTGKAFRGTLPPLEQYLAEWTIEPFRRGFGWSVQARFLAAWNEVAPRLFETNPIGSLHLHQATLDDWRRLAASDWVRHLRQVTLATSPIEPVRVLSETPAAGGVTLLRFLRCSGQSMPEVVEDLLRTPFGRGLRELYFHLGYPTISYLVDALAAAEGTSLQRLSFANMGLTGDLARRLFAGPGVANLTELDLHDEPLGDGLRVLTTDLPAAKLHTLRLSSVGLEAGWLEPLAASDRFPELRVLDLSRNRLTPRSTRILSLSWPLSGLRLLKLKNCQIGDKGLRHLARAKCWPNLVELDLRGNPISGAGAKELLAAEVPPDLTALVLDGDRLDGAARAALRRHFGDAVVFCGPVTP